jgi:hypothetical protein
VCIFCHAVWELWAVLSRVFTRQPRGRIATRATNDPYLLDQKQFRALTLSAKRITSSLEKLAAAVVQDPKLMGELGLTEVDHKMAFVGPGFSTGA